MDTIENQQKYYNYKVQSQRLKKALSNRFYLEAIFIEYAIMEDRTASILRYEGNSLKPKDNGVVTLNQKVNKIKKIAENKKGIPRRYFTNELMDEILEWKNRRNSLIHALVKQSLSTEELKAFAEEGNELAKTLSSKSQNYKRYLMRRGLLKEQTDASTEI